MTSSDDAPDTSYYQWVTFMFCIQAALFYLPYRIWTALEGGVLASFGTDGKTPVMIRELFIIYRPRLKSGLSLFPAPSPSKD